jgi:hypothetical protein
MTRADNPEEPAEISGKLPEAADTATGGLEETTIHDVLSNERRRKLLSLLANGRSSYTLRELSERIAEQESGESPAPRNLRQSVYVSLQQTHVPRLIRLGIIEYEEQNGTNVVLSEHADDVTVYLEVVPGYELAWSEFYLGISLLGLLTVVATVVGVPVLSLVPPATWAGVFFGVIVLSAAYHTWTLGSTVFHRTRGR